jgi:hypothetical protein
MDESVRLSVIAADEAEALHGVEEFHRSRRFLAGQLALRSTAAGAAAEITTIFARCPFLNRKRIAFDLEVGCRDTAATIHQREFERLAFGQAGQSRLLNCRDMDEHVFAAIVAYDEAEAFLAVEELYDALAFADHLGGHSAAPGAAEAAATTTAAVAAATISAATAAAAAIRRTVAAAEAATIAVITAAAAAIRRSIAAAEAATITIAGAEIIFTETVALVSAAPAAIPTASFIKTHAFKVFPAPVTLLEPPRWAERANGLGA